MPSGFVEVSGYSQTDLDAAYQRGVVDGGSAVKGNATAAQVLQGYTFSSASAGSNKIGTMVNRGSVSQQLNPNSNFSGLSGYYSSINIQAKPNTQSRVMTQSYEDLGADNLIRYADARNIVSAARQSGYDDGKSDGFDMFVPNATLNNSDLITGYGYPGMDVVTTVWNAKTIPKNSIILFSWGVTAPHSSTKGCNPTVTCRATSGSVEWLNSVQSGYDNWVLGSDTHYDSMEGTNFYKVLQDSVVQLQFSFTGSYTQRGRISWSAAIIKSSTS